MQPYPSGTSHESESATLAYIQGWDACPGMPGETCNSQSRPLKMASLEAAAPAEPAAVEQADANAGTADAAN